MIAGALRGLLAISIATSAGIALVAFRFASSSAASTTRNGSLAPSVMVSDSVLRALASKRGPASGGLRNTTSTPIVPLAGTEGEGARPATALVDASGES